MTAERATCIKRLFWPHLRGKKIKLLFSSVFLLIYKSNSQSVNSGINSTFTVAMVTKMAAKIG